MDQVVLPKELAERIADYLASRPIREAIMLYLELAQRLNAPKGPEIKTPEMAGGAS